MVLGASSQKRKNKTVIPQTQEDSLKLEGVLIEAEKQLMLENYSKALESFTIANEMNTQSAVVNFKIAEVYARSDEGQKALPYGLKAIELDPENKYYKLGLARIYQSIGFYIDAANTYKDLLEQIPSEENALYELAELYQITGQVDEMFLVFDQIEKYKGVQEEIIREKQRIYMKQGKLDETIAEYDKLVGAYPNEISYRIEYISFLIQNKKLDKAEIEIEKIEETGEAISRVSLLKSELLWMKGNSVESLNLLKQAFQTKTIDFDTKFQILSNYVLLVSNREDKEKLVEVSVLLADQYPEEFKAQAFAGDMLYQIEKPEESLNYYLSATQLGPSNFSVWQNILNVESNLNRYDSVIVHAEKALEYFPNQAILYYYAGTGYLIKKNFKRSVSMLDQGKKYTIDPKLLTVFYGQMGDAYHGMKEKEKSYGSYEKALQSNPQNDHVLNNYSYYLSLDKSDLDKALQMSERLVNAHPENPTYLDTHGWVLYVRGDYKEAKKYLKKAAEMDQNGTILEHYGDVLFQLGEVENAVIQWEEAKNKGETSENIEKKIADRKLYE